MIDLAPTSANLLDLSQDALQIQLAMWKQPKFRAKQIWEWLYVHLASRFDQMTNLPKALRQQFASVYTIDPLTMVDSQTSSDGFTTKTLFGLPDGETVESVLMRYDRRNTVCVSTQVGCPIGCAFCATGQNGFTRDLSAGEIIAQPLVFGRQLRESNQAVTNIVLMGMGEPLLNYEAMWQAVETWNDHQGFGIGARKITISTAGLVPGIEQLAQEHLQVGLAVSLHAPNDALRDQLVPLNKRYPLAELLHACHTYIEQTRRRITIEYALIDGINDSREQAQHTARLLNRLMCHVNLIPLNPSSGSAYGPSPLERVQVFQRTLEQNGIQVTVRLRRGIDIQAGCGQLRQRNNAA